MKQADGTYKASTVHYDGYPSHMVPILSGDFNDEKKAEFLMTSNLECIERNGAPTFILENVHSERGFEYEKPDVFPDLESLLTQTIESQEVLGVAHTYFFEDGEWYGHYSYAPTMKPQKLERYQKYLSKHVDIKCSW